MAFGSGRSSASLIQFGSVMGRTGIEDSAQFQVVTETMVDGPIVIDSASIIRYVNRSLRKPASLRRQSSNWPERLNVEAVALSRSMRRLRRD